MAAPVSKMAAPEEVPVQEFTVRVPNNQDEKSFHVMKFNNSLKMDFTEWSQVRMVRENNQKTFNTNQVDDSPKFGAGSAFGKDAKEEARRLKLGIRSRKYNSEAQPWLMKIGGTTGRKYRGVREGGVTDNTTFYVFSHGQDGLVQAYPLSQWYNFSPMIRYKTFDAEEAEEKFAQRGKILNKWAVMVNKKVKSGGAGGGEEEEAGEDEDEKKTKVKGGSKDLKISDMDDWDEDNDAFDSDSDKEKADDDDEDDKKNKRSKDSKKKKKKKKRNDGEAFEDSDDGDGEGLEVDYMSDESSDSEQEQEKEAHIQGVDQDEGLAKMLDSDSSSEDEDKKKEDKDKDEDDDTDKKKKKGKDGGEEGKGKKKGSKENSRSTTPTEEPEKGDKASKRKAMVANILDPMAEPNSKKSRLEQFGTNPGSGPSGVSNNDAISEEAVRRYLKRRPMTTTDLLKKFRSKRTGIQNAQLVQLLAHILKKINPHKQKTKGVTYLSLKEN